jgi:hypothetical protein
MENHSILVPITPVCIQAPSKSYPLMNGPESEASRCFPFIKRGYDREEAFNRANRGGAQEKRRGVVSKIELY